MARNQPKHLMDRLFSTAFSGSSALMLLFPTLGYYTLATYVNVIAPESSVGSIVIRTLSLFVLLIVAVKTKKKERISWYIVPGIMFMCFYFCRMLQNVLVDGISIPPDTTTVLLTFVMSSAVPAVILFRCAGSLREEDFRSVMWLFVIIFLFGLFLNRDALSETSTTRLELGKINPISLAYTASNFILFMFVYMVKRHDWYLKSIIIVPLLIIIIMLAKSRGAMLSNLVTIAFYLLVLRGSTRIWGGAILGIFCAIVIYFVNQDYMDGALEAIERININTDASTAIRYSSFSGAWQQFMDNPVFGRYILESFTGYYPHNIYLESLMAVGFIGAAPFFVHVMLALRASVGLIRRSNSSVIHVFMALLFIRDAIGAAASGAIWGVPGFWIASFLSIAFWYGSRSEVPIYITPLGLRNWQLRHRKLVTT